MRSFFNTPQDEAANRPNKDLRNHSLDDFVSSINLSDSHRDLKNIKSQLHKNLINAINVASNVSINSDDEQTRNEVRRMITELINASDFPLASDEIKFLSKSLFNDIFGLGPIQELMRDSSVSDILVNGYDQIYVERNGVLEKTNLKFDDQNHLVKVIKRIANSIGRRIDDNSPMVDARLKDGSRVNAIIPPLALDGAALSIRKFKQDKFNLDSLVKLGTLNQEISDFLTACVRAKLNILVSGGTGSGKTTFLNALSEKVHNEERILTIEDAAELQLSSEHVVRLETRPANIEGQGEIRTKDLLKNALRMRPDRIIVGEIRGEEAIDLLQAMNTGHDGSMGTLHANSANDSLKRMETMCLMGGMNWPVRVIREQVSSAIHIIVQLNRFLDGSRYVTAVQSIEGITEEGLYLTKKLYGLEREKGLEGKIINKHVKYDEPCGHYDKIKFFLKEDNDS